jgi:hypothetical protein
MFRRYVEVRHSIARISNLIKLRKTTKNVGTICVATVRIDPSGASPLRGWAPCRETVVCRVAELYRTSTGARNFLLARLTVRPWRWKHQFLSRQDVTPYSPTVFTAGSRWSCFLVASCLTKCSAWNMEPLISYEMSLNFYRTGRRHSPECRALHCRPRICISAVRFSLRVLTWARCLHKTRRLLLLPVQQSARTGVTPAWPVQTAFVHKK